MLARARWVLAPAVLVRVVLVRVVLVRVVLVRALWVLTLVVLAGRAAWRDVSPGRTDRTDRNGRRVGGAGLKARAGGAEAAPPGAYGDQSKMGSRVRERFSSKKPSVPAISRTPSHSRPAASPRGMGDTTGPNTDSSPTEITGVPTS